MTYTTLLNLKQSLQEELWEAHALEEYPDQFLIELIELKIKKVDTMISSIPSACDKCIWKNADSCKICKEVK